MKRNRSKYTVFIGPDGEAIGFKTVHSKLQAKKLLYKSPSGSYFVKQRLTWYRTGGFSFWNTDDTYDYWVK